MMGRHEQLLTKGLYIDHFKQIVVCKLLDVCFYLSYRGEDITTYNSNLCLVIYTHNLNIYVSPLPYLIVIILH